MRQAAVVGLISWFAGGTLLGLIEAITLPADPNYSTLLQLLPLLLLAGGIWLIISQYQKLLTRKSRTETRLRRMMGVGWFAFFGVNVGVASLHNMAAEIFHYQLPYYFQGVSLAQKIIALVGIFILGIMSSLSLLKNQESQTKTESNYSEDLREKPLTSIGFIALLLGVVLGLAQYWQSVVFAAFNILLAGIMLYAIGKLTEKDFGLEDGESLPNVG